MSHKYLISFVLPLALAVFGCTETVPGDDDGNVIIDIPEQVDQIEVADDLGQPDVRPDIQVTDEGQDTSVEDVIVDPCAQMPYGFGCICEENPECASNWCISMPGENYYRCTMTCYDNCPEGWKCQEVLTGGSDTAYICRPTYDPLCDRECEYDSDCQSAGAMCVQNGSKSYCQKACDEDADCGSKTRIKECDNVGVCTFDGDKTAEECAEDVLCEVVPLEFQCVEVTNVEGTKTTKQCISTSGHCECASDTDYTTDPNHCGDCETRCFFPHATADCQNSACKKGGCLAGFVDLNLDPVDGCEYECMYQSPIDHPDSGYVDADCDGIDGDANDGVFVKNGGDDDNFLGDMAHPFATINAAIAFAAAQTPIPEVYVSKGIYQEQVNLVNGVSVYGGYDAENKWRRNLVTNETNIMWNGQEGVALRAVVAKDITEPTIFDGFRVSAAGAGQFSSSSYGMHVVGCDSDLVISNNFIEADNASSGRGGTMGTNGQPGNNGTKGSDAFVYDGCGLCICTKFDLEDNMKPGPGGTSPCGMTGGSGGKGGELGDGGLSGTAGTSGGGYGGSGAPGEQSNGTAGGKGADGADGNDGSAGVATGEVNATGFWVPLSGGNGVDGTVGKGGGGGGGGGGDDDAAIFGAECYSAGGAGGGGGGGGCGGTAGTGGQGGGGSFGLFLVQSSPQVINNTLKSRYGATGGIGGTGGAGGSGGAFGAGGADTADGAGAGAAGGAGGGGGDGGHGGGGPGGPSFSMYISGGASKPTCSGNTFLFGGGGDGGYGGGSPSEGAANKGQTGNVGKIFGVTANCTAQ